MVKIDDDGGGAAAGSEESGGGGEASGTGRFDASQYAFFGKDVLEEVELGGFEDDDGDNAVFGGLEEDYQYSAFGYREEEGEVSGSLSDIDDLTSTFAKVNKVVTEQRNMRGIGGRGSFSRESSSATDWTLDSEFSNCHNRHLLEAEQARDGKRYWSQPHPPADRLVVAQSLYRTSSSPHEQQQQYGSTDQNYRLAESKALHRTSSYPQEQEQYSFSEPPLLSNLSFPSYPPLDGPYQASPNHLQFNNPTSASGLRMPFAAPDFHPFSRSQLAGLPQGVHYHGNMPQFHSRDLSMNNRPSNHWLNQSDSFMGNPSDNLPPIIQQRSPHSNGLMPLQRLPLQQQHILPSLQQSVPHFPHVQPRPHNPYPSPRILNNFDAARGIAEFRDPRLGSFQREKHTPRFPQQGYGTSGKNEPVWPQFRSKYMTSEEIESIMRMQHIATHSNDPYVDDYYHQACLAKRSEISRLKHHFCPSSIKDLFSRPRPNNEPHAFLQIDALGRVPFSSVRRPRPLLEVDPPSSGDNLHDNTSFVKPLDQEPMLAARITIEDGICHLLDIDDIDRLSQFSQPHDGGSQLKQRRHVLLEGIATSLHLVDPLNSGKSAHSTGLEPNDDVFLRLVSLPKGQKLLSQYLQRLPPGSELTRVVCMAIFRHLRFLFGTLPSDSAAAEITTKLIRAVCSRIQGMDLSALSACLAAIVCSHDQPPFRPLGSPAGDGASVIIKSVLERATELLTNPNAASNYSKTNRALWQASFDAFFGLLTQYCLRKYESITQSQEPATRAISLEMPVELLRASLPHTDEQQRKMLHDFAQRSMPVSRYNSHGNGSEAVASKSLPS